MAREMALAGVDPSELTPPPPVQKPHGFREKWENYWYHYKWQTWIAVFAVAVLVWILVAQFLKETPDYILVAVTEQPLLPQETEALEGLLASCGKDIDANGAVEVQIENLNPAFHDQMAPNIARSDTQKLIAELSTGDRMLFVFDNISYDGFIETVRSAAGEDYRFFMPLSGNANGYNAEGCFWNWRQDARRERDGLETLPRDLYFGVRSAQGTAGGSQSQTMAAEGADLLTALMNSAE